MIPSSWLSTVPVVLMSPSRNTRGSNRQLNAEFIPRNDESKEAGLIDVLGYSLAKSVGVGVNLAVWFDSLKRRGLISVPTDDRCTTEAERESPALGGAASRVFASYAFGRFR